MNHQEMMKLALTEAAKGVGRTAPNPPVGALLVKRGKVIAKGYHRAAGKPHAEIEVLRKVGRRARGAILYVTLEPCAHEGKTPPCTEAIAAAQLARVVVGMRDPNPQVNGRGLRFLKKNRIPITTSVLRSECESFYAPYRIFVLQKRPFVILKAGMSLDGMVATQSGESQWITGEAARQHAHRLRDRVDAVLVGLGTVQQDDPRLTTRLTGRKKGHDPIRVLLDSRLRVHPEARLFRVRSQAPTWVLTTDEAPRSRQKILELAGAKVFRCRADALGQVDLKAALRQLANQGVMTVLVEGGPTLSSHLLAAKLADRLSLYISMKLLGKAMPAFAGLEIDRLADAISLRRVHREPVGEDLVLEADLSY